MWEEVSSRRETRRDRRFTKDRQTDEEIRGFFEHAFITPTWLCVIC